MKKFLFILMLTVPALTRAQCRFTLTGKVGVDNPPAKVFLLYRDVKRIVIESTAVVNGRFKFTGSLQEPTAARLILDHKGVGYAKTAMSADMTMMFLHQGNIQIESPDSLKRAVFPGSAMNKEYRKYQQSLEGVNKERQQHYSTYQAASQQQRQDSTFLKAYTQKTTALDQRYRELQMAHVKANPDSYISLSLLKEAGVPLTHKLAEIL